MDTTLQVDAFEHDHRLVKGTEGGELVVPDDGSIEAFLAWINKLPEREPPTYLGLPANAEKLLLAAQSKEVIDQTRTIGQKLDEGEQLMDDAEVVD